MTARLSMLCAVDLPSMASSHFVEFGGRPGLKQCVHNVFLQLPRCMGITSQCAQSFCKRIINPLLLLINLPTPPPPPAYPGIYLVTESKVLGLRKFAKKVVKRLGVLTMPALKYCVLRGSFSEMFDSLARITSSGGLRTRARTHGIKVSEL
jgi:hypothetical protein